MANHITDYKFVDPISDRTITYNCLKFFSNILEKYLLAFRLSSKLLLKSLHFIKKSLFNLIDAEYLINHIVYFIVYHILCSYLLICSHKRIKL